MTRLALFLSCLVLFPATTLAWTRAVEQKVAGKAASLAPPDLSFLIERHKADYQRGLREAANLGCTQKHAYALPGSKGPLRSQIQAEITFAVHMMRTRKPINEFIHRLGLIAHLVSDANNPFLDASAGARFRTLQPDFEAYLERRLSVIPTVFYGLEDPLPVGRYLDASFARTSRYSPLIEAEYATEDEPRRSAEFDDRSTAFGVISLAYSHTVTDLVNIYYHVWRESGGDVRSAKAMKRGTLLFNPSVPEPAVSGGEH